MKSAVLMFWLVMLVVGSVGYGSWLAWRQYGGSNASGAETAAASDVASDAMAWDLPPGKPLPDFQLTDQRGHKFNSSSLRGKVWVASYFFASCPGPCFRLNQALSSLQGEPSLADVKFVSITCDPTNDSPEALKIYSDRFNADSKRWFFLTGELNPILDYARHNFLLYLQQSSHTDTAVVVDRNSTVRGFFHLSNENDVNHLRIRLAKLLKEPMSAAPVAEKKSTDEKTGDGAKPVAKPSLAK